MARFNPAQPFPLLPYDKIVVSEVQAHAAQVDAWLGLDIAKVEQALVEQGCRLRAPGASGEHQELWFGLAAQSLLTPYSEIREILTRLSPKPGETVVDLGAAYGRMGFVIARHFPGVSFIGYEYVGERVRESAKALARFAGPPESSRVRMEHADLSSPAFSPAAADYYFIYDYGTSKAIEKTLYDLRRIARSREITIIGRGRRCREAIENRHPWLINANPGEPAGRVTLYRSVVARSLSPDESRSLPA